MSWVNLFKRYSLALLTVITTVLVVKEVMFYSKTASCVTAETKLQTIESVRISVPELPQPLHEADPHYPGGETPGASVSYETEPSQPVTLEAVRLQLYGGRCVIMGDNAKLVVGHCDPNKEQSFSLDDLGYLRHDSTGLCVRQAEANMDTASLGECDTEFKATYYTTEEKYNTLSLMSSGFCLTPLSESVSSFSVMFPCLGDRIGFSMTCQPKISDITFIPEPEFQKDRTAMTVNRNANCDFRACNINEPAPAVEVLLPKYVSRCTNAFDCVTVITKTARRPYLVTRLAESIREFLGHDLRIISYDDGPNDYGQEVWDDIDQYPHLNYIVGDDDDMGISLGRNLAIKLLVTKYFLLVDDDHVFTAKTNIRKMIDILDTTDASLVGGKFEGFMKFAGAMRFGHYHEREEFAIFSGYCERNLTELFPNDSLFSNCEQCDSTSNIFLAKTEHAREVGGWSNELKIAEHADFFVKLKAFNKKVVYCDDIEVINKQEAPGERSAEYQKLRYDKGRKNRMFRLMNGRYNVNGLFWCSDYQIVEGELVCLTTKHKIGYC